MNGGVGLQGSVIKEAKGTKVRVFSRLCLVGSQRAESDEHGGIDCNGIVDLCADDMLDDVDRFGRKVGRRFVGIGVLDPGTKDRAVQGIRAILVAGRRKVFKFVQGFWNVGRYGNISGATSVIPGEGESV